MGRGRSGWREGLLPRAPQPPPPPLSNWVPKPTSSPGGGGRPVLDFYQLTPGRKEERPEAPPFLNHAATPPKFLKINRLKIGEKK